MKTIINVKDEFENCIKAESDGVNVLILRKLDTPIRRFDRKMARYELEHRWLSKIVTENTKSNVVCVLGQDYSYWMKKEIDFKLGLFEQFRLF
jgi:hypothetical protein